MNSYKKKLNLTLAASAGMHPLNFLVDIFRQKSDVKY